MVLEHLLQQRGVVARGAARVDAGIEAGRRLEVLVAEQLPDQLEGAGRMVEQDLRGEVAELMRRNLDAGVLADDALDQLRERLGQLRDAIRVDEQAVGPSTDDLRCDVVAVLDQHSGEVRGQVEGDRLLVLDLVGRNLEARYGTRVVANEQMPVEGELGEVLDAQRHVGQDLLRQRSLSQGERAVAPGSVASYVNPKLPWQLSETLQHGRVIELAQEALVLRSQIAARLRNLAGEALQLGERGLINLDPFARDLDKSLHQLLVEGVLLAFGHG